MAKHKQKKNLVLNPAGMPVTSEVPNIPEAIASSGIAERTVENMQSVLNNLSQKSQEYALPSDQLFLKLSDLGVDLETTTELYAVLKQAYLTTIYVLESTEDKAALVTNTFSLVIGNMVFFNAINKVPVAVLTDVLMIVTNIMFQMEAGTDDTGEGV